MEPPRLSSATPSPARVSGPPVLIGEIDDNWCVTENVPLVHLRYAAHWTLHRLITFKAQLLPTFEPHHKSINDAIAEGEQIKTLFLTYLTLLTTLRKNTNFVVSQADCDAILSHLNEIMQKYNVWEKITVPSLLERNKTVIKRIQEVSIFLVEDMPLPKTKSTTVLAIAETRTFVQFEKEQHVLQYTSLASAEATLNTLKTNLAKIKAEIVDIQTEWVIVSGSSKSKEASKEPLLKTMLEHLFELLRKFSSKGISDAVKPTLRAQPALTIPRSSSILSKSWFATWRSSAEESPKVPLPKHLKSQFTNVPKREKNKPTQEEASLPRENIFTDERWNSILCPPSHLRHIPVPNLSRLTQEQIWIKFYQEHVQNDTVYNTIREALNSIHASCLLLQIEYQRLCALHSQVKQNPPLKQVYEMALRNFMKKKVNVVFEDHTKFSKRIISQPYLKQAIEALDPKDTNNLAIKHVHKALMAIEKFISDLVEEDKNVLREIREWIGNQKNLNLNVSLWITQLDEDLNKQSYNDAQADLALQRVQSLQMAHVHNLQSRQPDEGKSTATPSDIVEASNQFRNFRSAAQLPEFLFSNYLPLREVLIKLNPKFGNEDFETCFWTYLQQMTEQQLADFEKEMLLRERTNLEVLKNCFKQQAVQLQNVQKEFDALLSLMKNLHWDAEKVKQFHKIEDDGKLKIYLNHLLARFKAIEEQGVEVQDFYKSVTEWQEVILKVYVKKFEQKSWYESQTAWSLRSIDNISEFNVMCEHIIAYFKFSKLQLEHTFNIQIMSVSDELVYSLNDLIDLRDNTGGMTSSMLSSLNLYKRNENYVMNPFKPLPKTTEAAPLVPPPPFVSPPDPIPENGKTAI